MNRARRGASLAERESHEAAVGVLPVGVHERRHRHADYARPVGQFAAERRAVLFAAGLHLCVAVPCANLLEFSRGENPLLNDLTEEGFDLLPPDGLVPA